jgi:hypothetical protein
MARLEHIKRRLDNWAIWKSRGHGGALGYHSRNILAVDVWARGSYNGAMIPVFEQEAEETDQAVRALETGRRHLVDTLASIYLHDLGINETARRCGVARATVCARLEQADAAIDAWLQDRAAEKDRARAAARAEAAASKRSFTP